MLPEDLTDLRHDAFENNTCPPVGTRSG